MIDTFHLLRCRSFVMTLASIRNFFWSFTQKLTAYFYTSGESAIVIWHHL
jgi:hypothetical protein